MTTLAGSTPIAFVAAEERPLTANCGPTKLVVDLPTWTPPAAVWTFRMLLTTLRMVIRTIVLCIFCATWIPRGEILLNAADIDRDATPSVNGVSNNEVSDSIVDDVNADDDDDEKDDDDDESSVEPTTAGGLVTAIANDSNTSDSDRVWRIDAVPRLFGSASEWPDCRLAREGVNVQWKGVLLVAQAGSYVFTTRHNSLDQLTISLNGKAIRLGHPFELEAGESELVIDAQQRQPPFAFELWWRGPGFADEPVDARFFGHHDRHRSAVESLLTLHQSIERGAVLAEAFGCRQCHSIDGGWYRTDQIDMDSELSGPRLDDVGHRLRPERIRKYHSPQSFLGTVQDPVSRTNHTDASRAVISDYLIESSNDKSKAYSETTADAVHGEQLFQELGCVACHVTTPTPDVPDANPADRSPVPAAGNWKHWKLLGLAEFLRNPLASRPHGRMPQFPLNEQESVDLASYCLQLSTGSKEGPGTIQSADATTEEDVATLDAAQRESRLTSVWSNALKMKGSVPGATYSERLAHVALRSMVQLQCVHCHALNGHNRLAIVRDATGLTATFSDGAQPARVPVAAIRCRGGGSDMPARGCLSADDRNSPRFSLSDRERQDLMTYVSQSGKDATPSSHSRLQVELASKNCLRCHKNEGHGGAGLAHWGGETNHHLPPDLSRVAERVRLERLTEWVTQGAGTRAMRSYVRAKMPAYGREAKRLANLLVDRDGVGQALQNGQQSYTEQIPTINNPEVNPALVRLGQFLVGSKALACANCHALHGKQLAAQSDPTTRGPDLGAVVEHLRPEYFSRWLMDPARVRPGTKMPQSILPDGSVPIPTLTSLPFNTPLNALWSYLSQGDKALLPVNEVTVLATPQPDQPAVQRGQVDTKNGGPHLTRGMALGFSDGTLLFDADRMQFVSSWFDGFVRPSEQPYYGLFWNKEGEEQHDASWFSDPGLKLQLPDSESWQNFELPLASDPNHGTRLIGYQVGKTAIRLQYQLVSGSVSVLVTEDVSVQTQLAWQGLARSFRFEGLPNGARIAMSFPQDPTINGETEQRLSAIDASPVHTYQALGRKHTIVAHGAAGTTWLTDPLSDIAVRKLVSGPAIGNQPMGLRIDCWRTTEIATDANTPTRETWGGPSPEAAMAEFNRTAVPPPSLENLASLNDGTQWFPSHLGEKRMNVASMRNEVAASYRMEPIPGPFFGFRPSDIAFAADGTMYVIAMTEGQIWRTTIPPADNPSRVRWQRFATGLDHPIGLQVIDGNRVYVSQKPEITELIDVNGDGVADRHRTVASGWGLSHGWHEYTFGLAADREQNLWFTLNTGYFWTNPGYVNPGRFRGSVMRVDHGTDQLVEVAKGCRVPNGISVGPNGDLFFTDNQGDWIQSCKLAHVVPGRFYGHPETAEDALPEGEFPNGRSTIWLPYEFSRSSSGPVLDDTGSRFGPFSGQMLLGDVGYGANPGIMRISLEKVDGEWQGACFRFTRDEPHGCLRMKFGPDNQLYLASLTTGLTRVRFLGQDPLALQTMAIRPRGEGFVLQLTKPLATSVQLKPEQFHFRRYHYLYTGQYGSPEAGNQDVTVSGVELSANRRTIVLTLPVESHPLGMVYHMTVDNLVSDEGLPLEHNEAWYTVHRISQQP